MKLEILGNYKYVKFTGPEKMLDLFGEVLTCKEKDGILYVNEKVFREDEKKFGRYLSADEIVEDIYREARRIEMKKLKNLTFWDIAFEMGRKAIS